MTKKIKVRAKENNCVYEVLNTKENLEMFNNKKYDFFFIKCSPEESSLGFNFALMDKEDVIEVINND